MTISVERSVLRLGARGSALSRAQAELVRRALGGDGVEVVYVTTTGDRRSAEGLPIEWKGDFTRELDEALRDGRIDLAVHSLKDVPSQVASDLVLAAVPPREDPSDVLVSNGGLTLERLAAGARIGTSSPRRRAQILATRPDLTVVEIRGNVDTRVRRLREGRCDALVLARAGLARLGRLGEIVETLSESVVLPAPGQGALAIFARAADTRTREALAALDDPASHREVLAERRLLAVLEAGCRAPVAARARREGSALRLTAAVFSGDGSRSLRETAASEGAPEALGEEVARRLLARGAAELIGEAGGEP
ncbi:MAG TPA: hydroxymethylbilane synthase [Thermoanaerobaculia bacterium]|nr:hydroxymethylbilane synthase [Thermoanaerobaculia bacterium]